MIQSKKAKDYDSNVNVFFAVAGEEETEEEKQNDYLSRLSDRKSLLESYKEELQMLAGESIETESNDKTLAKKSLSFMDMMQLRYNPDFPI
jgi:hypothetical protein